MPNGLDDELTKEEENILYDFVKDKTMFETNRKSVRYFLSVYYQGIYDMTDIERMLSKLERKGYLSESIEVGDLAYGIKVVPYIKISIRSSKCVYILINLRNF